MQCCNVISPSSSFSSYSPVFYSVCLFLCNADVQLWHQRFGGLGMFGFHFFAIFASRLSFIPFTCSSLDPGPSYDILNPANVANSIPQSAASDAARFGCS